MAKKPGSTVYPGDPHVEWWHTLRDLRALTSEDAEIIDLDLGLSEKISTTPAKTDLGAIAQLHFVGSEMRSAGCVGVGPKALALVITYLEQRAI